MGIGEFWGRGIFGVRGILGGGNLKPFVIFAGNLKIVHFLTNFYQILQVGVTFSKLFKNWSESG